MKTLLAIFCFSFLVGFSGSSEAKKYAVGENVDVEWKGSWYPAEVIGFCKAGFKIHYTGYSASWDECVGSNRMSKRSYLEKEGKVQGKLRFWR